MRGFQKLREIIGKVGFAEKAQASSTQNSGKTVERMKRDTAERARKNGIKKPRKSRTEATKRSDESFGQNSKSRVLQNKHRTSTKRFRVSRTAQHEKVGFAQQPYASAAGLCPREINRSERQRCCSRRRLLCERSRKYEAANLEAARARRVGTAEKRGCCQTASGEELSMHGTPSLGSSSMKRCLFLLALLLALGG
jgi:hypothetical protein